MNTYEGRAEAKSKADLASLRQGYQNVVTRISNFRKNHPRVSEAVTGTLGAILAKQVGAKNYKFVRPAYRAATRPNYRTGGRRGYTHYVEGNWNGNYFNKKRYRSKFKYYKKRYRYKRKWGFRNYQKIWTDK